MRKLSFLLLAGALFLGISCTPDIEDLYNRVEALEKQVAELTALNSTVSGLSVAVEALQGNVYVKSVTETADGYVIEFTNGKTATIKDGEDGQDATAPTVGVKEVDGELVWTVNGEVVKDASGNAVPATVKVPEFKFDNNKWWYRFGANDTWKDCGEKTGPEPSITETDEFVIITIGDKSVQIPKEVISPAIEAIKPVLNALGPRLFVPAGESIDLKDFFEVEPEGALKSMVDYTPADDSPFTVSEKGILTCTGGGNKSVVVSSKANPDIKLTITVRSAECPNNETPVTTINPEQKVMIFGGSLEDYNTLNNMGGSSNFNPVNNSHTNAFSTASDAAFNFRFAMPVEPNSNLTMDNARLHMWFYISDASVLSAGPTEDIDNEHFLEITSSGVHDADEVNFNLNLFVPDLKTGWNEVDLPFSQATNPGGNFDITKTCFMRFVGHANTNGKWEAIQIRDYFVYVPDAPVQITIDGDLSDWAKVKGVTNTNDGATYLEFKMASDADNIYFYTKRVPNTALWNGGGYLYYGLDYDNDTTTGGGEIWGNGPYECIFVIWPFAGTGDAPAFADKPLGDSMIKPSGSLAHYNANGKADDSGVELEFSIPRADLPELPATEISVYAWGNKSGENMKNFPLKITL